MQDPGILESLETDRRNLADLVRVDRLVVDQDALHAAPFRNGPERSEGIRGEADHAQDAENLERYGVMIREARDDVIFSGVHHDPSSSAVLTMDFVTGQKLDDAGTRLSEVAGAAAGGFVTGLLPGRLFDFLDAGFERTRQTFLRLLPVPLVVGVACAGFSSGIFRVGGTVFQGQLVRTAGGAGFRSLALFVVGLVVVGFFQIVAATLSGVVVGRLVAAQAASPWRGFIEVWAYGPRGVLLGMFLFAALVALPAAGWGSAAFLTWYAAEAAGFSWTWIALVGGGLAFGSVAGSMVLAVRWSLAPYVLAVEGGSLRAVLLRSSRLVAGGAPTAFGLVLVGGALTALAYGIGFAFVDVFPFESAAPAELRPLIPSLVRAQIAGTLLAELPLAVVHIFMAICWMQMYGARIAVERSTQNSG